MASDTSTKSAQAHHRARSPLAELRREAGYRSSRDFAAALGIPATTYSRYERTLADPESGVPIRAARSIADRLGCSIDAVVGRADGAGEEGHDLNATYRSLSESGKTMLDEYVKFLDFRDRVLAAVKG